MLSIYTVEDSVTNTP